MIKHSTLTINNTTFEYSIKAYEEPSEEFGLNGGKISKLTIKRGNKFVYNYDREPDIEPVDAATVEALNTLICKYN